MTTTYLQGGVASAPYFTGIAGSAISVFDFALVTTLGWTKVYTGTNAADYQHGPSGHCLSIVDTAGTSFTIRPYASMSALGTGLEPYSANAVVSTVTKSDSATATTKNWRLISNGTNIIMQIAANLTSTYTGGVTGEIYWGDFVPRKTVAVDAYTKTFRAGNSPNMFTSGSNGASFSSTGAAVQRPYTQAAGFVGCSWCFDTGGGGAANMGTAGGALPSVLRNNITLGMVKIGEQSIDEIRGILPGIWVPQGNVVTRSDGDVWQGYGPLASRSFMLWKSNVGTQGFVVETSNTW